ncbi:MAG: NAD(P)-dependent dehydrogenase (short-subunit alcohol dehydrogenase family) [Acidimicrobiales bacterium]|jgi:NAD(P)-dependent dehydrogenase (short-subunit alcohol dehydrogenase family)
MSTAPTSTPQITRTALVTGGGSGIGRATAIAMATAGWSVTVAGRRAELLDQTVAAIEATGQKGKAVTTDVGDPTAVAALFEEHQATFGRLDLLFNNAGSGTPPVPIEELTFEQWKHVVDVNLTGSFLCAQQAVAIMKQQRPQGGRIINNGSISAHTPRPNSAPYTSTKHAITGLTKSLDLDGRPFGISCGQIDIGNAESPLTASMPKGMPQADGSVRPEPLMDVAHAANAVVHMAELPAEANILFLTVKASAMPYVGRG